MAKRKILPIFIPHLGCPNDCVFCDQRRISGSPLPASGADVVRAIEGAKAAGFRDMELAFYGGSFTAIDPARQEELLQAAQPYVQDGTVGHIRLSTRPDAVDAAAIQRLRRYGVQTVELGAQSMVDQVLYESGRGHTARDTEQAVSRLREGGFFCILQMMTGLPGSSEARDVETARRIIALHPDGVRIYPTVIVEGTPLADLWRAGRYQEHTVAQAVQTCARILPMMEQAGIPVIRLGLNPTEELSGGAAIGGAYHPAFGELVRSEIMRRQAAALLEDVAPGSCVTLGVPPGRVSPMIGQHRQNVRWLTEHFGLRQLKVRPTNAGQGEIVLLECREN
jgi:histone acetyltransferase (RNA polymerase elongator complex component)